MRERAVWMRLCQPACPGCLVPSQLRAQEQEIQQGKAMRYPGLPVGSADAITSLYCMLAGFGERANSRAGPLGSFRFKETEPVS